MFLFIFLIMYIIFESLTFSLCLTSGHKASKKHIYDESQNTRYCFEMQIHDKLESKVTLVEPFQELDTPETDNIPSGRYNNQFTVNETLNFLPR
jgi:hypothetical protein